MSTSAELTALGRARASGGSGLSGIGIASAIAVMGTFIVVPSGPFSALTVVALAALPLTANREAIAAYRPFVRLFAIWAVVVSISSVFHDAQFSSTLFTISYPLACGLVALLITYWCNSEEKLLVAGLGVGLALILGFVLQPIGTAGNSVWKTGLGYGLIITCISVSCLVTRNRASISIVCAALGAAAFLVDYRNPAILLLVTAVALHVTRKREATSVRKYSISRMALTLAATCVVAGVGFFYLYGFLAENGTLGTEAKERYDRQSSVQGGLLLGARPELAVSLVAIRADPIFGRGGAPKATFAERNEAITDLTNAGFAVSSRQVTRLVGSGINSHSLFFTAWVVHGFLGGLMWVVLAGLVWFGALKVLFNASRLSPLLLYGALQFTWDCFFSPWSPRGEAVVGLYIALAVYAISASRIQVQRRGWLKI